METMKLKRIGENAWGYMTYQDMDTGKFYIDLNYGLSETLDLHTCSPSDDMDGEPDSPLRRPYEIVNPITEREKREKQYKFKYMMLSRLQSDCVGFFGRDDDESSHMDCRYHNEHFIWGKDIRKLVSEMKRLWDEISEDLKPEWLTREEVEGFCKRVS